MNNIYDVVILGAGVAGAFAAYKISQIGNCKCCIIEFGRPPGKRRKQLEGWLGCFPSSNARLYSSDVDKVSLVSGKRITNKAYKLVNTILEKHGSLSKAKNKEPSETVKKRLNREDYSLSIDNYTQWKPESIHLLSRDISGFMETKNVVECMFDTEIKGVVKEDGIFKIQTENGLILSKNILLALGRSGWRFVSNMFIDFGIVKNDSTTIFGFRGEMPASYMKDWCDSHCSIMKNNMFIGPLSWRGTVIPEDHVDLVTSSWRSNENRWHTDKVSFSVMKKVKFKNKGSEQLERLGKLAYVLSDNRVSKLRTKEYLHGNHDICLVPEYDWIKEEINEIDKIILNFIEKGSLYFPDIITSVPSINIYDDFSTDMQGLYVAGESSGIRGILSAAISGVIAGEGILK